ncbi:peroxisomal N(1)-acetyl-spermine/spermidine oxidase-like [Maniola hyperantus]|uniref:peroxisomal N(1)-acetyl-spermine/spermidine oxidase-like n=1 Tax=Aphantopus hyperantus TaxID=2795564 RepID=UPI00156957A8|nr:peroxisomal N(1)-acetyl-spermine/spermidine oxidase-like [Maniola hyperantus]
MGKRFFKLIFLLFILGYAVCYVSKTGQSYDTIIVGLGAAGTTAASTLAKAGKKVLALEAQDRIGGRVWTVPFGDGIVELGAEWIHGTDHNNWVYKTAVKNNISVFLQDTSFKVYKSDGTEGNKKLIDELLAYLFKAVQYHPSEKPEPLGKFLTKKLMEYLKKKHPEVLNDHDFISEFLDLADLVVNSDYGSTDWNNVTSQSDYEQLEGNQHTSWHRYGYKTFIELLLNTYKNGTGWPTLEIKLNKEVILINWPKKSTGDVEVVCKDGSKHRAKNVIVTVSLGVLKERYWLFSPPIPANKATVIDKLSMGVVGKTIFSFQQAWWPDAPGFFFFWSPKDKEAYKNYSWVVQIKSVAMPMGSSNTLSVWSNGDTAKLIETLPEDVVKSKMMEIIKKFMGKNLTVPEPSGMLRSKWYSNPFTRGCYTYDNLLKHDYPNARAILGEPLLDATGSPKVLFAGEATDLFHFSTVHGASESGFREASRLLPLSTVKRIANQRFFPMYFSIILRGNLGLANPD